MINLQTVKEKINAIETEMKRIGFWQSELLPQSAYEFKTAFGADAMSLAQWLQFIFIPRVHELIQSNGPWPETSEVGVYASQQYLFVQPTTDGSGLLQSQGGMKGQEDGLVKLLQEFDAIFSPN